MVLQTALIVLGFIAAVRCSSAPLECTNLAKACKHNVGDYCNYNYLESISYEAQNVLMCGDGLYCGGDNACHKDIPFDGPCNVTHNYCAAGSQCDFSVKKCIITPNYLFTKSKPGAECSKDSECGFRQLNPSGTPAINSTCIEGRCFGLPEGATCDYYMEIGIYQCLPGLYCVANYADDTGFENGTCEKIKLQGEVCTKINEIQDGQCGDDMECYRTEWGSKIRTCQRPFQGQPGEYCNSWEYCIYGYSCDFDTLTCADIPFSSMKPCSSDDDCVFPENCQCSPSDDGKSYCKNPNNGKTLEEYAYVHCHYMNKCADYSCAACRKELCAFSKYLPYYEICALIPEIEKCQKGRISAIGVALVVVAVLTVSCVSGCGGWWVFRHCKHQVRADYNAEDWSDDEDDEELLDYDEDS